MQCLNNSDLAYPEFIAKFRSEINTIWAKKQTLINRLKFIEITEVKCQAIKE